MRRVLLTAALALWLGTPLAMPHQLAGAPADGPTPPGGNPPAPRPGVVTAPPPTPAAYTPQSSFTTAVGFPEANNTPFASDGAVVPP
jgi:hypothetical protein